MKKNSVLIADNIDSENKTDERRSALIRRTGIELAKKLKSKVDFLFVEDINDLVDLDYSKEIQEKHIWDLQNIKKSYPGISTHYRVGSAPQEILKFVNKTSPEFVLMGTHGEKGLKKLFVGSAAEEVLRNSKRPVIVLGPKTIESDFKFPNKIKILLATDLTKSSAKAEKYAVQLANRLKAQLTIFYSEWEQIKHLQESMVVTGLPLLMLDNSIGGMKKYIVKKMTQRQAAYKKNKISCEYILNTEPTVLDQLIVRESLKDYSLIVMGTQSRNRFIKAFLGSNARKVILNSPIPVVVVRS